MQNKKNEINDDLRARILNLVKYRLYKLQKNLKKDRVEIEDDAEDITQETLKIYWDKYSKNTEYELNMRIINKITRNKIGNYIKSKQLMLLDEQTEPEDKKNSQPDELIEESELRENIFKSIKGLNKNCQKIIELLLNGDTRDELLSNFIGLPINTVDSHIHRCREKLRKKLQEIGYML